MDNTNDEYEEVPLREGEYLVHPDPRIASMHKWLSDFKKKGACRRTTESAQPAGYTTTRKENSMTDNETEEGTP